MLVTHTDADTLGDITSFLSKEMTQPKTKPNICTLFSNLLNDTKSDDIELMLEAAKN